MRFILYILFLFVIFGASAIASSDEDSSKDKIICELPVAVICSKGWVGDNLSGIGEIILSFYNPKKDDNLTDGQSVIRVI